MVISDLRTGENEELLKDSIAAGDDPIVAVKVVP